MSSNTSPRRRLPLLGTALALLAASVFTAAVSYADGVISNVDNANCKDFRPAFGDEVMELRVNAPGDGTFTSADGFSVLLDVYSLAADDPDHNGDQTGSQVFDFTTSGGLVLGVAVKGGPKSNLYDYRPDGRTSGTALHAPVNQQNKKFYGLSHISLCYLLKANPAIETQVSSAQVTIGESFTDTATLSGGIAPTGTIAFNVYGPDDADCSGTATLVSTETVNGNGDYTSDAFTPSATGKYRWIASYSGDANNTAVSGACNDANEDTTVIKKQPAIVTNVSAAEVTIGDSFTDTATLSGGHNPTGTIAFNVYGPDDADCSGTATLVSTETVNGNGDYTSDAFTPSAIGKYRWIASYGGDANNEPVSGACNDANEDTTVDKADPAMVLTNWVSPQARAAVTLLQKNGAIFGDGDESGTDSDDVTITLYEGADCEPANAKYSEGFQIDGDGAMPQSFQTSNSTFHVQLSGTEVTWSWQATYEGDAVNSDLTTECQNVAVAFSSTP